MAHQRLLICSIFVLIFTTAQALMCYQCSGLQGVDHECETNLQNVNTMNCTPGFFCIHYIQTLENVTTIHRLCTPETYCDVLSAETTHILNPEINRTINVCTTCNDTDYCNAAKSFHNVNSFWFTYCMLLIAICSVIFVQ